MLLRGARRERTLTLKYTAFYGAIVSMTFWETRKNISYCIAASGKKKKSKEKKNNLARVANFRNQAFAHFPCVGTHTEKKKRQIEKKTSTLEIKAGSRI